MLRSFTDPSAQAAEAAREMGVDLSAAAIRSKGLVGAIEDLIRATEGSPEAISQLIPEANAQQLVIALSSSLDGLESRLQEIQSTSGLTDQTLADMNDSLKRQKEILDAEVDTALRNAGRNFEALQKTAVGALASIIGKLNDLDTAVRTATIESPRFTGRLGRRIGAPLQPRGVPEGVPARFGGEEPLAGLEIPLDVILDREGIEDTLNDAQAFLDQKGPIGRPQLPVSVDFSRRRVEETRAQLETAAFLEFARTGDLQDYNRALRRARLRVNDLVEAEVERLRQAGVESDQLQELVGLYERGVEAIGDFAVEVEEVPEKPFGDISTPDLQVPEGPPPLPGGRGFGEVGGANLQDLRALRDHIRGLNTEQMDQAEIAEAVKGKMEELGLTYEDLGGVIKALLQEMGLTVNMLGKLGEEGDDSKDDLRELAAELQNLAQLAGGIFQLADAFGVFGDEASDALQQGVSAANQLAQGIGSLQEALAQGSSGFALAGPIGAIAGGAAGIIGAIGGLIGGDDQAASELRSLIAENNEALRRLSEDMEKLRSVMAERTGEELSSLEELGESGLLGTLADDLRSLGDIGQFTDPGELLDFPSVQSLLQKLDELGISLSELESVAASADVEIGTLLKLLRGEAISAAERAKIIAQAEDLGQTLRNLDLERIFESFSGQMELLQQQFEVFDIEDPIRQLERMREVLLGLETNLPPAIEAALRGADLSTAAGRRRLDEVLRSMLRRLQAGELTKQDLGGLTVKQLRELINQFEGTLDEAAQQEGGVGGFQQTRGITEVTANRITGRLTTLDVRAMKRNEILARMLKVLGGKVPANLMPSGARASAPKPPRPAESSAGVQIDSLSIGPIDVELENVPDEPRAAGEAFGDGIARRLDRKLGHLMRDRER